MTSRADLEKQIGTGVAPQRTSGERLFEEYLGHRAYNFVFEPETPGKLKRPDYLVTGGASRILCEVKQFERDGFPTSGVGAYDPYPPIREKIDQARKKFQEYKNDGLPCCLVLYAGQTFADIENHLTALGSMYGDAGMTFTIDAKTGTAASDPAPAFLGRGRMIRPGWKEAHNTTISAIITIRHVAIGRIRLEKWLKINPREPEDILGLTNETVGFDLGERQLGVIVFENAFAATPLPRDLFTGPYDLRWGVENDGQRITYKGQGLP